MTTIAPRLEPKSVVQRNDWKSLAAFRNEACRALSFYFSSTWIAEKSHRAGLTAIKQLARSITSSDHHSLCPDLMKDIAEVVRSAERMQEASPGFKAIFACAEQRIWQEFDLPFRTAIHFLKTDDHFYLVPLFRAMESCRPYCVVLAEHGKARGFVARGDAIDEVRSVFTTRDLQLPADDSRVGWSHHIEDDKAEHALVYFHELGGEITRFLNRQGCEDLVMGCRENLWSEIGPCLGNETLSRLRGEFHLPGFDSSPDEVLRAARVVFDADRRKQHARLLGQLYENPRQREMRVLDIARALEAGRVQTLLLGPDSDQPLLECAQCDTLVDGAESCVSCAGKDFAAVNAQEFLLRKALLNNTEVVAVDSVGSSVSGEVAALLRY